MMNEPVAAPAIERATKAVATPPQALDLLEGWRRFGDSIWRALKLPKHTQDIDLHIPVTGPPVMTVKSIIKDPPEVRSIIEQFEIVHLGTADLLTKLELSESRDDLELEGTSNTMPWRLIASKANDGACTVIITCIPLLNAGGCEQMAGVRLNAADARALAAFLIAASRAPPSAATAA